MDKQFSGEKMFYKIGEVSSLLNVSPSQLRFWEKEFNALNPKKNLKGERIYTKDNIETIQRIIHLRQVKGYTVAGTKEALKIKDHVKEKLQIIKKLENLKAFLEDVKKRI